MTKRTKIWIGVAAAVLGIATIYFAVMAITDPCGGRFAEVRGLCWSDRDAKFYEECLTTNVVEPEDAKFCEDLSVAHRRCDDYARQESDRCGRVLLYGWLASLMRTPGTEEKGDAGSRGGLAMVELEALLPGTPAEQVTAALDRMVGLRYMSSGHIYANPDNPWFSEVMIPVDTKTGEVTRHWRFEFRRGVVTQKNLDEFAPKIEAISPNLSPAKKEVEDKILGTYTYDFGAHPCVFEKRIEMPAASLEPDDNYSNASLNVGAMVEPHVSRETLRALLLAEYESGD